MGPAYSYSGIRCLAEVLTIRQAMVYNHALFLPENATNADVSP